MYHSLQLNSFLMKLCIRYLAVISVNMKNKSIKSLQDDVFVIPLETISMGYTGISLFF